MTFENRCQIRGRFRIAVACCSVLTGASAWAQAEPPPMEVDAPEKSAFETVLEKALAGDARAQVELATAYEDRYSAGAAVRWFRKAAEQGDSDAMFKMGYYHTVGQGGVKRDVARAVELYKKAADLGQRGAQYNLAVCYEKGVGVERNDAEAFKWHRKAAEQGDDYAQKAVGVFLHQGKGVKKDLVEAYAWYYLSASRDNPDGIRLLVYLEPRLSEEQIAEGRNRGSAHSERIFGDKVDPKGIRKPEKKGPPKDFLE